MRLVIQRVKWARVEVTNEVVGAIDTGLLVLVGATHDDSERDADLLAERTVHLRIFQDEQDKMNLSLLDVGGSVLAVSQFTLYADTRRGRRPAFTDAMEPQRAQQLFEHYKAALSRLGVPVASGVFGARMDVSLCNEGPVTIILNSEEKRS